MLCFERHGLEVILDNGRQGLIRYPELLIYVRASARQLALF